MFGNQLQTPEQAYDSLWARGRGGIPIQKGLLPNCQSGIGHYFQFDGHGHQLAKAFPDIQEPLTATLLLVAGKTSVMLRLVARWDSSYGSHESAAEYSIAKLFGAVEVTAGWTQTLPSMAMGNVGIMTDDGVQRYHIGVLHRLRVPGKPIAGMLYERYSSVAPVTIPSRELIPIAEAINDLFPKF